MSGENRPPRYDLNAACAAGLELASHYLVSRRCAGRAVRNPGRAAAAVQVIRWPVATIRHQPYQVAVGNALSMIAGVVERLEWEHAEIGDNVEAWRAKQAEFAAALGVLVPGIVAKLAREKLIAEGLEWLARFEASYAADEARDNILENLAAFNAIAAGQVPHD